MKRRGFLVVAVVAPVLAPFIKPVSKECCLRVQNNKVFVSENGEKFAPQTFRKGRDVHVLDELPETVQVDYASIQAAS